MEKHKLEILDNFMDEVKEFTKRISGDILQSLEDRGISAKDYLIIMYFYPEECRFFGRIYSSEPMTAVYGRERCYSMLIDFLNNQDSLMDKYKNLIIKFLKDDKSIVKSNLCFELSNWKGEEDFLDFNLRKMHYLRLCSDLDYNSTHFHSTLHKFEDFYALFAYRYKLREEIFKVAKLDRKKFFADYFTLTESATEMTYTGEHTNNLHHFFSEVGGYLNQKQIEAPFIKIIKNKTMEKDCLLLKEVNDIVCGLVGEDNINSEELKELKMKCEDNIKYKSDPFSPLSIKGFKSITFNSDYFSQYIFKYKSPSCFKKLSTSQCDSFNNLIIYLLTSENAKNIYGVLKASIFHLPTGEKGFFMQTNKNYSKEKLYKGIGVLCKFIEKETIRDPLEAYNEGDPPTGTVHGEKMREPLPLNVYIPSFSKYESEKVLINLEPYLLEIKLKEVLDVQQEVNIVFEDKYKI